MDVCVCIPVHMHKLGAGSLKRARAQCWWLLTGQGEEYLSWESSRETLDISTGAQEAEGTSWDFFASYNQVWGFVFFLNLCI